MSSKRVTANALQECKDILTNTTVDLEVHIREFKVMVEGWRSEFFPKFGTLICDNATLAYAVAQLSVGKITLPLHSWLKTARDR
jgi:uncharacterized protein YpmS